VPPCYAAAVDGGSACDFLLESGGAEELQQEDGIWMDDYVQIGIDNQGDYYINAVDATRCKRRINLTIAHGHENVQDGFDYDALSQVVIHPDNIINDGLNDAIHYQAFVNSQGNMGWGRTDWIVSQRWKIVYIHGKARPSHFFGGNGLGDNHLYRFDFGRHKGKRIDEVDLNYLQWCVTEKVYSTRKDLRAALISKNLLPFESQEQMQRMKNTEAKVLV
jgi:hypothetical protein